MTVQPPFGSLSVTTSLTVPVIVPPVPAYYNHPQTVAEVNRHVAGKVLSQFGLGGVTEWNGMDG